MNICANPITIRLQIALNKRMYDVGNISYGMYSQTNEILVSRLTNVIAGDSIIHSESI